MDSLNILHLGNIVTSLEASNFMENLESFLDYANKIGKLTNNYSLYGERQVKLNVSSPGDVLFELIKQHPNFKED